MEPTDTTTSEHSFESFPAEETHQEHRSSPRYGYPYRQRIAPIFGGHYPTLDDFFDVVCVDLCGGGFSFCLESRPQFDRFVVELGPLREPSYLSAEVVHVEEICRHGAPAYRAGCRFTERPSE